MIKKIYRRIRFEIFNRKNIVINSLRINRDKKQIKELKNIYENQRCFIVGNGPSLKVDDLENFMDTATINNYKVKDNPILDAEDLKTISNGTFIKQNESIASSLLKLDKLLDTQIIE